MIDTDLWCVRAAFERDARAVVHLGNAERNRIGHLPTAAIEAYCSDGRCLVAEHVDAGIIGYVLGRPSLRYDRRIRPVTQLVVDARFRRGGVATELIVALMDLALRDGRCMLQAWSRNDLDARHLWRDLGWTAVAERSPSTARGKPATLWRCALTRDVGDDLWTVPPVGGWKAARQDAQALLPFAGEDGRRLIRSLRQINGAGPTAASGG